MCFALECTHLHTFCLFDLLFHCTLSSVCMWLSQVCMCLCVRLVRSSAEVMQLINSVLKLRSHSPTLVHMDSSRSHFIVTLTVTSKSPDALALGMIYSVFSRVPVPNSHFLKLKCSLKPYAAICSTRGHGC